MGVLDRLSQGVNKGIAETERMLELGKLRSRASELERERTALYAELGRVTYESARRGEITDPAAVRIADKLRGTELESATLERQIAGLTDQAASSETTVCACGARNGLSAAFCSECGAKIEHVVPDACAHCGAPLSGASAFCVKCGTPTAAPASQAPAE